MTLLLVLLGLVILGAIFAGGVGSDVVGAEGEDGADDGVTMVEPQLQAEDQDSYWNPDNDKM